MRSGRGSMDEKRIVKSALNMSAVTFVSRVFGLVRDQIIGYLIGTSGSSDAFTLAFRFPNLLRRLVGEGAMLASFVPVFSGYVEKGDKRNLDDFVHSFFTLLFVALVAIVVLGFLLSPLLRWFLPAFARIPGKLELTIALTRLMFPYVLFISLSALTQSILNTYKVFVPSAATPILLNLSIIGTGVLLGFRLQDPALALGAGVLLGGVLQFFFPLPFMAKKDVRFRFVFHIANPGVRRVFLLMLPAMVGAGVYQINVFVSDFIAALLEGGSVAALRFSNTLVEVVLGIFIISISTVILPALSSRASKGDLEGMKSSLSFALRLVFLVTIPAALGLFVLRTPIIRMLFRYGAFNEQSTAMVSYALAFQALGLCGVGGARVTVQMFFSMKDTKTPVYVAAAAMAVNLGLCFLLAFPLGSVFRIRLGGIALAGSTAAYVNFLLLLFILERRVGRVLDRAFFISAAKAACAAALMALPLWYAVRTFGDRMAPSRLVSAGFTLALLLGGVALYFIFNLLLGNGDIVHLKDIFLNRLKGKKDNAP
jgi:putative peptidoglycan lipid II flippase